jgi:hypothetical protein
VQDVAELADGSTGCGEGAEWWVFIWLELQCEKVSCTYGHKKTLDQTGHCHCISDSLLAYRLKIPPAKKCALHYTALSKKMDGISNRYNLKSTGRIYTFGVLKCSENFKVLDLP